MRLLIKQRVFSWTDTFDIYDENEEVKYFAKGEFLSLGHRLHVYNRQGEEVGMGRQRLLTLLPKFDIEIGGQDMGCVEKKFTFFKPKYELDYQGWRVDGDFLGWNYQAYQACCMVLSISKEPFHWGDTYVIDIAEPQNELMGLMLVLAIDAANCDNGVSAGVSFNT